jgi:hypothetical protein
MQSATVLRSIRRWTALAGALAAPTSAETRSMANTPSLEETGQYVARMESQELEILKNLKAREVYVAPDGKPGNSGAKDSPVDLKTAYTDPKLVTPGTIVWIASGTWLWTLAAPNGQEAGGGDEEAEDYGNDGSAGGKKAAGGLSTRLGTGYSLEYDAARRIAQGLGAHLEKLAGMVDVKSDTARLLSVAERTEALFGKDQADAPFGKRMRKYGQMKLDFTAELEAAEAESGGWGEKSVPKVGETVLDRVHQSMILFAAGRGEALRRFLVDEGTGRDQRYWRLAQALSALYPAGTDEKRWVDGILARKKGMGF